MFSPLMFEGNPEERDDNAPPVRVWKLGSIVNSVFIGCLPQILLQCIITKQTLIRLGGELMQFSKTVDAMWRVYHFV